MVENIAKICSKTAKSASAGTSGISVIEAILALAIAALIFTESLGLLSFIREGALDAKLSEEAALFAAENLRVAERKLKENFFTTDQELLESGFLAYALPEPFTTSVKISDVTPCRRKIESTAEWQTDTRVFPRKISFSGLAGSPSILGKLGGDCGGNDSAGEIGTSTILQTMPTMSWPDVSATGVDIFRSFAFVSAISARNDEPDLIVIKPAKSSGQSPQIVSYLDIGLSGTTQSGFNALDAAAVQNQNYIFAAQNSTSSQLVVVNVENTPAPFLVASSTLPGVAGVRPEGRSIFFYDSKIYIGTKRTAGHEFHVFDVSNPTAPVWLGSREVNHNINAISVRGGFAFLATSGNIRDLIILNVSNPAQISQVAAVDLPGNEDGKSLYLIGNTLLLGRFKSIAGSGHHDFYALDISKIKSGGEISILGYYDVNADINSIKIAGHYAYLGTSATASEFSILNIASSTKITKAASLNLTSKIPGIDFENGIFSVVTSAAPGFLNIEISE